MSKPLPQLNDLQRMTESVDGHELGIEWTMWEPDSMEGRIHCSCGWSSRNVKSCWFVKVAHEHTGEAA